MRCNLIITFTLLLITACNTQTKKASNLVHEAVTYPKITRSNASFSLVIKDSLTYRALVFQKHSDSTTYRFMKYNCRCDDSTLLQNETQYISQLWSIAKDSININLINAAIGYPLMYKDVLLKHIEVFKKDSSWQRHLTENGKTIDHLLIRKIMNQSNIYDDFQTVLKNNGYQIDSFSTEKHGFVQPKKLVELGYSESEFIPMPYMVFLNLSKRSE